MNYTKKTCVVWYHQFGTDNVVAEVFGNEEMAADIAAIWHRSGLEILGVQYANGKICTSDKWKARIVASVELEKKTKAFETHQIVLEFRSTRDPFTGRPTSIRNNLPEWCGNNG